MRSICILLLILASSAKAQFYWQTSWDANKGDTAYYFTSISSAQGLSVAVGLSYADAKYSHQIFLSTDSGNSWMQTEPPIRPIVGINDKRMQRVFCLDKENIYIVGDSGLFLFSNDGGKNWKQKDIVTNWDVTDVSFIDTQSGIATAQAGFVYITNDGGESWKEFRPWGTFLQSCKAFVDGRYYVFDRYKGKMLRTFDSGSNWDTITVYSDIGSGVSGKQTSSAYFKDSLNGFLIGAVFTKYPDNFYPLMMRTSDGGANWHIVVDSSDFAIQNLISMTFLTDKLGIAVGHGQSSLVTTDGGDTWKVDSLIIPNQYWLNHGGVAAINTSKVIAITDEVYNGSIIVGDYYKSGITGQVNVSDQINIYPSPANSQITIESTFNNIQEYRVYDVLGRLLKRMDVNGDGKSIIDATNIPSGKYMLCMIRYNIIVPLKPFIIVH